MNEFRVLVDISNGVGRLRWEEQSVDLETLQRAISLAADDAILAHELRRLQVELPEWDQLARTALHRCGFRLEGRLRSAVEPSPGVFKDLLVYARLATDPVYGPHGFSGVLNSVLPLKRVIAHAVLRNPAGEVLLLETTYKKDWELPGGVVEPGEAPRAGAQREIAEELGLEVSLEQPLLIDWMPPYLGWSDAVEFIFDGGVIPADVLFSLQEKEIKAAHWVAADQISNVVTALSARRLIAILNGERGYSESGTLVR